MSWPSVEIMHYGRRDKARLISASRVVVQSGGEDAVVGLGMMNLHYARNPVQ